MTTKDDIKKLFCLYDDKDRAYKASELAEKNFQNFAELVNECFHQLTYFKYHNNKNETFIIKIDPNLTKSIIWWNINEPCQEPIPSDIKVNVIDDREVLEISINATEYDAICSNAKTFCVLPIVHKLPIGSVIELSHQGWKMRRVIAYIQHFEGTHIYGLKETI